MIILSLTTVMVKATARSRKARLRPASDLLVSETAAGIQPKNITYKLEGRRRHGC